MKYSNFSKISTWACFAKFQNGIFEKLLSNPISFCQHLTIPDFPSQIMKENQAITAYRPMEDEGEGEYQPNPF